MNRNLDQDRVDNWLREAFRRDRERIESRAARIPTARLLAAVHARDAVASGPFARMRSPVYLTAAFGVAAVLVVCCWVFGLQMDTLCARAFVTRPTVQATSRDAAVRQEPHDRQIHPARDRGTLSTQLPGGNVAPGSLALREPNWLATTLNLGNATGVTPSVQQPFLPLPRKDLASATPAAGKPIANVRTWNLRPSFGKVRGSGVLFVRDQSPRFELGPLASTVGEMMCFVSDLQPRKTYLVTMRLRSRLQPVTVGTITSDDAGMVCEVLTLGGSALAGLSANSQPHGATPTAPEQMLLDGSLVPYDPLDVTGIGVVDPATGAPVLETPPDLDISPNPDSAP